MKAVNNGSLVSSTDHWGSSGHLAPLLPSEVKKEEQFGRDLIMRRKSFLKKYPGQEMQLHRMSHWPNI